MFYKLNEYEKLKIEEASKKTFSKYEINNGYYITVEELMNCIKDLIIEVDVLEEKLKDFEAKEEKEKAKNILY